MDPNKPNRQNGKDQRDQRNPNINLNNDNSEENQNNINEILSQVPQNPILTNLGSIDHVQLTISQGHQLFNLGLFNDSNLVPASLSISSTGLGNVQPFNFSQPSMPMPMPMPHPYFNNNPLPNPNPSPNPSPIAEEDRKIGQRRFDQDKKTEKTPESEKNEKQSRSLEKSGKQVTDKPEQQQALEGQFNSQKEDQWIKMNKTDNQILVKNNSEEKQPDAKGDEVQQLAEQAEVEEELLKMELESNKSDENKPQKENEQKKE